MNINDEYDNFEQPFQLLNKQYKWYYLYIEVVHVDFRNYVIEKLIEKLNEGPVSPNYLENCRERLEDSLNINLNYNKNNQSNKNTWSYSSRLDI